MRLLKFLAGFVAVPFLFVSCGSTPKTHEEQPLLKADYTGQTGGVVLRPAAPIRPTIPASPEFILGRGAVDSEKLAKFLLAANPEIDEPFAHNFARLYVEEAAVEGVNHDIAFSQMCLETGFLSFNGLVKPEMNNFGGLGAIGPGQEGESFPSPQIGVRAQIQHLKAYATEEPPRQAIVDPRYRWVRYGSAPTIFKLSGSWAADVEYGEKIKRVLDNLYAAVYGQ
ncbi:MAG: glucosaminidase domain-containing protein [Treponema sp.]|jgi:hypothetical protein|nr:glucosaminidase domain-containing protein [Treponema sp.]